MAGRIISMRKELYKLLTEELKTPGNWDHIINQIGMFRCVISPPFSTSIADESPSFTGIKPEQSKRMTEEFHIYLTQNGRISMAGLNTHNVRTFAEALDKVVRG